MANLFLRVFYINNKFISQNIKAIEFMCKLGLFDYLRQVGTVHLHKQGTLSDARYEELKSAQKMIRNFIKDTDCRVDIYDAQSVPADKFVYTRRPDSVYIEVNNLLNDKIEYEEFVDKAGEPMLKRIFKFIDKSFGKEPPVEELRSTTIAKLRWHNKISKDPVKRLPTYM